MLEDGASFAVYEVQRRLAVGGMGEVYLCRHRLLQRLDAVKVLRPHLAADELFRKRFLREALSAARLRHPHVVTVYTADEAEGHLYLAMEYVDGIDLYALLNRERVAPQRAVRMLRQGADALDGAHRMRMVHRDVKPSNLLLTDAGQANEQIFLCDFGISKEFDTRSDLTRAGETIGTPAYCAPEQLLGHDVDGATDQYSLACVAFEMLTGQLVFPRENSIAMITAHLTLAPPPLSSLRPDLPAVLDAVFGRALAKSPKERFSTCTEFIDALDTALAPPPPRTPPRPPDPPQPATRYTPGRAGPPGPGVPPVPGQRQGTVVGRVHLPHTTPFPSPPHPVQPQPAPAQPAQPQPAQPQPGQPHPGGAQPGQPAAPGGGQGGPVGAGQQPVVGYGQAPVTPLTPPPIPVPATPPPVLAVVGGPEAGQVLVVSGAAPDFTPLVGLDSAGGVPPPRLRAIGGTLWLADDGHVRVNGQRFDGAWQLRDFELVEAGANLLQVRPPGALAPGPRELALPDAVGLSSLPERGLGLRPAGHPNTLWVRLGWRRTPTPGVPPLPVPLAFGLAADGAFVVRGTQEATAPFLRWLIAQCVVMHAPRDLCLVAALAQTPSENWQWLNWLPHARPTTPPISGLHAATRDTFAADLHVRLWDLVKLRVRVAGDARAVYPRVLAVLDEQLDPAAREIAGAAAGRYGVHVVYLAPPDAPLPAGTAACLDLDPDGRSCRLLLPGNPTPVPGIPDGVSTAYVRGITSLLPDD
jgi:serine/threonine protein kinase